MVNPRDGVVPGLEPPRRVTGRRRVPSCSASFLSESSKLSRVLESERYEPANANKRRSERETEKKEFILENDSLLDELT